MTCFFFEPLLNLPFTYHRADRSSSKETKKVFILIEENTENFLDVHSDETKLVLSSFLISCVLMFFRLLFLTIYFLGFMTLGCLFVSSYPIWSEMVIFVCLPRSDGIEFSLAVMGVVTKLNWVKLLKIMIPNGPR